MLFIEISVQLREYNNVPTEFCFGAQDSHLNIFLGCG